MESSDSQPHLHFAGQSEDSFLRALTLLHAAGSRLDPAHRVRVADGGRRRGGAGAREAARSSPRTVPYLTQGNAYYPLSSS